MAGAYHTVARKTSGRIFVWGSNEFGQLGLDNKGANVRTPTPMDTTTWLAMAAGERHTLALRSDGTLFSWGDNGSGQLGTPGGSRIFAAPVDDSMDWVAIAAGNRHSLAVKKDGSLWAWGDNVLGQLGDGTTASQRATPTRIGDATDWLRIRAGAEASYSIRTDGTLWSWGRNHKGQLGLGDLITRRAPERVA